MVRTKTSSIVTWLTILSMALTMSAGTLFTYPASARALDGTSTRGSRTTSWTASYPELSRYATDLTATARHRRSKPSSDAVDAIERAITILSEKKRNPVIIEEVGLNTRAVAEGVAQRIAAGRVPASLLNKRLFSLNIDALFAGLKTSAEVDARLHSVFAEAADADGEVILFVDRDSAVQAMAAMVNGDNTAAMQPR